MLETWIAIAKVSFKSELRSKEADKLLFEGIRATEMYRPPQTWLRVVSNWLLSTSLQILARIVDLSRDGIRPWFPNWLLKDAPVQEVHELF